ncbi:MAG: hypothetical protein ABI647_16575 [Gemmatimonadota bacterium]
MPKQTAPGSSPADLPSVVVPGAPFEAPEPPETATSPATAAPKPPERIHLVVVTTRAVQPGDDALPGATLITRFWHPRDHRWSENAFESLEHASRLFVEESGWILRQQQPLDLPRAFELIFEARRSDFTGPTTEEILDDVGLTPRDVAGLIDKVDRDKDSG